MDARLAGQLVKNYLRKANIEANVKARTISFEDLARGSKVFVKISPWDCSEQKMLAYTELKEIAKLWGFCVEFSGPTIIS